MAVFTGMPTKHFTVFLSRDEYRNGSQGLLVTHKLKLASIKKKEREDWVVFFPFRALYFNFVRTVMREQS